MPKRLYDIFNGKIGTTQIVGSEELAVTSGYRNQRANNDGYIGPASVDKTFFFADAALRGQDLATLQTALALFEANETQSVLAEGKLEGDAAKSYRCTVSRCKLASASLDFQQGDYAKTAFNFVNSAASGSTKASDEVTWVEVATKAITHSAALRAVRINSATYTPTDGSPVTIVPGAVMGVSLNIQGQVDRTAGDTQFGEVAEVSGYQVTGVLTFKDVTLATGETVSQQLMAEKSGVLALPFAKQNGAAAGTLTLANLVFHQEVSTLLARKFGGQSLSFECFYDLSGTAYTLATGSNKIITVA